MYAYASPPTRATTSITLSTGPFSIPLSVYTGTEETRVARKEFFNGDPNIPVGRAPVRKDTDEVIHSTDVVRMAQAANGAWVPLGDDEIAACTSPKGLAEIVNFIPVDEFDAYLTEALYQVRPKREKGKPNPGADKAFSLLLAGMREKQVGALVKLAIRGPARYAILTTEGDLLMVLTSDAIRAPQPLPNVSVSPAEVAMIGALIEAIGVDSPSISDETAPVVQAYVDAKAQGAPTAVAEVPVAATDDLMAALEASIAAAKAHKAAA